jgi:hypothetical protein
MASVSSSDIDSSTQTFGNQYLAVVAITLEIEWENQRALAATGTTTELTTGERILRVDLTRKSRSNPSPASSSSPLRLTTKRPTPRRILEEDSGDVDRSQLPLIA